MSAILDLHFNRDAMFEHAHTTARLRLRYGVKVDRNSRTQFVDPRRAALEAPREAGKRIDAMRE